MYFITAKTQPGFLRFRKYIQEVSTFFGTERSPDTVNTLSSPQKATREVRVESSHSDRDNEGPISPRALAGSQPAEVPFNSSWICEVCLIETPMRARHCPECRSCVLMQDFHCYLMCTCIGQHNRCFLWWYLFFNVAYQWLIQLLLFLSLDSSVEGIDYIKANAIVVISLIFEFLICTVSSFTFGYFSFLAMVNLTGSEYSLRQSLDYMQTRTRISPFSQGLCYNLKVFCCWWKNIDLADSSLRDPPQTL